MKKAELPEKFRETTLTGFKSKLGSQVRSDDVPSCFCEKEAGVHCQKHAQFEPTVETLIELLEEQVDELNKDEKSLDENLDFLGKSMNTILLSRRDTFKEQITRAYATKEEELDSYKKRCEEMEANNKVFQKTVDERDLLVMENHKLKNDLAKMRKQSTKEYEKLTESIDS